MKDKGAYDLLFHYDFEGGKLFKSQLDLVYELINNEDSDYYVNNDDKEEFSKAVNRLKAYLSQLLSDSVTRKISVEFNKSLRKIIKHKLRDSSVDPNEVADSIISDIQIKNQKAIFSQGPVVTNVSNHTAQFIEGVVDAEYISIFTTREIKLEYEVLDRKISFIEFLLDGLITSLKNGQQLKYYRFNFPLLTTCHLFWRGLRKELSKYLSKDKANIASLFSFLQSGNILLNQDDALEKSEFTNHGDKIASSLLTFLSKNDIINVFHLTAPIYLVPSIALNPNKPNKASSFIFMQSDIEIDQIHKMTNEEFLLWNFFVWDNLKTKKSGELVRYSSQF